jgi:hypothetical protein
MIAAGSRSGQRWRTPIGRPAVHVSLALAPHSERARRPVAHPGSGTSRAGRNCRKGSRDGRSDASRERGPRLGCLVGPYHQAGPDLRFGDRGGVGRGAMCNRVRSRVSVQSHWVRTEADEGQRRSVLIPALLDEVTIPLAFRRIQAANLVGWTGALPHAGFEELARAVEGNPGGAGCTASESLVRRQQRRKDA